MSSEFERIALLRSILEGVAAPAPEDVRVGIGDDAAVFAAGEGSLVWTVDAQVEGTHFRLDWMTWQDVGWRSVMAAASDLAAMAATPVAALASLVLAPSVDDAALAALAEGQAAASRVLSLPIAGGNLARGRETSLTTTVLGRTPSALLRSGARPSDVAWVAGALGLSAAGLALLERGEPPADEAAQACLDAFRRPRAQLEAGLRLRGRASAAIDVSDGLAGDAAHVAEASGVTIVLEEPELRRACPPALVAVARLLGRDAVDLALAGGEDYAVLAFAPAATDLAAEGFRRVGRVVPLGETHVLLETATGLTPVAASGYDHFRG